MSPRAKATPRAKHASPTAIEDYRKSPVLREIARAVPRKDIQSVKIRRILKRMHDALNSQDDGVALAAPQIGEALRIFVVSGRILSKPEQPAKPDRTFINPEIIKSSKKQHLVEEGCLSIRWLYGKVLRAEKVTIRALDEHGKVFTMGASGLVAQAFQHELDHLNGILFIDKAEQIENLPPTTHDNAN